MRVQRPRQQLLRDGENLVRVRAEPELAVRGGVYVVERRLAVFMPEDLARQRPAHVLRVREQVVVPACAEFLALVGGEGPDDEGGVAGAVELGLEERLMTAEDTFNLNAECYLELVLVGVLVVGDSIGVSEGGDDEGKKALEEREKGQDGEDSERGSDAHAARHLLQGKS